MAYFKCIGGSGGGEISNVLTMTETAYDSLQNKENDVIYNATNNNGSLILFSAQGNRKILNKSDISEYEFWYENLTFPLFGNAAQTNLDPTIYTDILLASDANKDRNWQLEFNVEPENGGAGGENVIIGTVGTDSSGKYEVYTNKSDTNLYIYGILGNDNSLGDIDGKDVVIKREGSSIITSINGTVVSTYTLSSITTQTSADYKMDIGSYRKQHTFYGKMNYIGFKWLS